MSPSTDELLEIRATLANALGGPHPNLTMLDNIIARQLKVVVFERAGEHLPMPLSEAFPNIDADALARLIEQLARGSLATLAGGAETAFIIERAG